MDSSEDADSWDIFASMFGGLPVSEIDALGTYWEAFPTLRSALFDNTSDEYCRLAAGNMKQAIKEHEDVRKFEESFRNAFGNFEEYLYNELISKMTEISISKTEEILSENIFERLKCIPLVDKYEAYQLLDDDWIKIAVDLEMIQTEGFEATKVVDPRMVVKKKGNTEQEVQEGWKGRILPFELIQNTLLSAEKQELKEKENRLSEITSEYEEQLDTLSEEEKEGTQV